MAKLVVTTMPCIECGKKTEVEVDPVAWENYTRRGMYVQEAFPDWSADRRELLITGTHPECWSKIFPPEEEVG
jgi:hypothetical protein